MEVKKYENIKNKLKESNETEKIKSFLEYLDQNNIPKIVSNLTCLCNYKRTKDVRIRSNLFLKKSINKEKTILVCVYNEKFICFSSKDFENYTGKINQGNSVVVLNIDDLDNNFNKHDDNLYFYKNKKITKNWNGIKGWNIFYCDINKFNPLKFDNYLSLAGFEPVNKNSKTISQQYYEEYTKNENNFKDLIKEISLSEYKKVLIPMIPECVKKEVLSLNNYRCLCLNQYFENYKCPCGDNIDIDYLNKNNLTYLHLHHFVPKKMFIKNAENQIDWGAVHNKINLVPLCIVCHQSIHKMNSNQILVKNVFNSIINFYKHKDLFDEFVTFLEKNTNTNLEGLLELYLNNDIDSEE